MHWLGVFANHFLPSGMGGDVVKGVVISRRAGMNGIGTVASIVVSRLTGLWGVLLVFFAGWLFGDVHVRVDSESAAVDRVDRHRVDCAPVFHDGCGMWEERWASLAHWARKQRRC